MIFIFSSNRADRFFSGLRCTLFAFLALNNVTDAFANPESMRRLRPSVDEMPVVNITNPRLHDPITPIEKNQGQIISENSNSVKLAKQFAAGKARPLGLENLDNVQMLYAEHHDEGKNAPSDSRKADFVYYDYLKNQTIKVLVDLKANAVEKTEVKQGLGNQPYFTRAEISTALKLIYNHAQMGPTLRKAYHDVTGLSLNDASQLDAQGGVFYPDSQTKLGTLAAHCATDRCMQLFIPIDDTHYLDATNIVVNLSSGDVLWVNNGIDGHSH